MAQDWREKMKEEENSSSFVKLDVLTYLQPKTTDGVSALVFYDKEKGTNVPVGSIDGMLIGHYMKYSSYHPGKEYTFVSTPFFDKDNKVRIFAKSSKGDKVDFYGTPDDCKIELAKITGSTVKMVMVLVVLREKGFLTIETNMSLGICETKFVEKQKTWKLMKFYAKKYNAEDFAKDSGLSKNFVTMAKNNPPTYCKIDITNTEIDEAISEKYRINEKYEEYSNWKKSIISGKSPQEKDVLENVNVPPTNQEFPSNNYGSAPFPANAGADDEDQLPF